MIQIKTTLNNQNVEAQGEQINGNLWIHFEGRTFVVENPKSKKKKRFGASGQGGGDLEAPMPGKITKILKASGENVAKGDVVLVMEAMKMEYTLKASMEAKIQEISCQIGDQVALGQTLVTFQSTTEG